jgi:hypothetical protein
MDIGAHPDVVAALEALKPYKVDHLLLWQQTLDFVEHLFIDYHDNARKREVDRALFALLVCPVDHQAQNEGQKGSIHGALSIIASDTGMSLRQVQRRHQRLKSLFKTVFFLCLRHYVEHYKIPIKFSYLVNSLPFHMPGCFSRAFLLRHQSVLSEFLPQ